MTVELPDIVLGPEGPLALKANPALLTELLKVLESEALQAGVPVSERLADGTTAALARAAFRSVGLEAPNELIALYEWHDGSSSPLPSAIPRFHFTSVEATIEGYLEKERNLREILRQEGLHETSSTEDYDWGAPTGWVALVPEQYTLAVGCTRSPDSAPLIRRTEVDFGLNTPLSQGVSLCTIVTWWIVGIRSGAHVWDSALGAWQLNESQLPALQREYRLI